ncbi:hypothetical protein [Acetanaerobacterium elongatum]|uniref:Uncharacterized protein n=1 Tax=Acetanaerobacterium elongatum TaxID=258515 RepID=A0A1H0GLX8_9FIRM|nr:hypothetical protein [Acetanaerobacterium elongatum]SDO07996.1 hypothetical protein SAMN05192585_15214 [Acetanaerobacterium elongatum]
MDSELFKSGLEQEEPKRPPVPHKRRRKASRVAAPIGLVLLLLCGIGLVTLVLGGIALGQSFINNDKEKAKFEKFLLPVVMYDPPAFESVTTLDQAMLLQTSMWAAILNNDDAKWAKDDLGFAQIPASELDVQAAKLYGTAVKLEHQSFGDFETNYVYNADTKTYSVPPAATTQVYTPKVTNITKKGDEVILRVGYVPPGSVWEIDDNGNRKQPDPDKYLEYHLQKSETGYIIVSLKYIDNPSSNIVSATSSLGEALINSGETSSNEGEAFGDASEQPAAAVVGASDGSSSGMASSGETSSGEASGEESSSSRSSSSKASSSDESSSSKSSSK